MICPVCGGAELVHGVHSTPYTYKGRTTTFQLEGDKCPACGEVVLAKAEVEKMNELMDQFERSVNAELYDPDFVLTVRKKLGLNQRQAGEIFGGGANAFSRYELGKAKPPQTLLQLFRLLDNDPSRLRELQRPGDTECEYRARP